MPGWFCVCCSFLVSLFSRSSLSILHTLFTQAFILACRLSSQEILSPALMALSRHFFRLSSAAVRHSAQGLCAYRGAPRNMSRKNADTSLTFIVTSRGFCTTYHVSPQLASGIVSGAGGWLPRLLCGRTVL